jgi:serine/threonine protein kinase, bacterial
MTDTPPSTLLSHRYEVVRVLGRGGFGTTYLVKDTQMPSQRQCVVKQLTPAHHHPQIHQIVQERFQREAATLERLGENHPQIPQLYAYFAEGDQFYLVEEWIDGDTLVQKNQREGTQSEASVRLLLTRLLPTIDYLHQQQIIHRDIKPDNIILRHSDQKPVLIDFGAVKETMSTALNSQGNSTQSIVMGTPGYMPLEQMGGRPTFASDIYSLGLTAIYLLTGKHPRELDSDPRTCDILWQAHAPELSPDFAALLNKAIHLQAGNRFFTAQEMLDALTIIPSIGKWASPSPPPFPIPNTAVASAPPSYNSTPPVHFVSQLPQSMPTVSSIADNDWKKAVIIGSVIGFSFLGGAFLLKEYLPNSNASSNVSKPTESSAQSPQPTPTPSTQVSPSPSSPMPTPTIPVPAPTQQSPPIAPPDPRANATIVGQTARKNVRSGPGTNYGVVQEVQNGDRVQIIGSQKAGESSWYQIYLFDTGVQGWIAAQLVAADNASVPAPPSPVVPSPATQTTNAQITGDPESKNIRSGPGMNFPVKYKAYPGDRVRVLDSQEVAGFTWYKIYFPESNIEGWIAGHLLKID